MKRAYFRVSADLIAGALAFPEGTKLVDIQRDPLYGDAFTFLVEHEDLPEVAAGEKTTELSPTHTIDYDKRPSTWIEFDWGIPSDHQ